VGSEKTTDQERKTPKPTTKMSHKTPAATTGRQGKTGGQSNQAPVHRGEKLWGKKIAGTKHSLSARRRGRGKGKGGENLGEGHIGHTGKK